MSAHNPLLEGTVSRFAKARSILALPAPLTERLDRLAEFDAAIAYVNPASMKADAVATARDTGKIGDSALLKVLSAELRREILGSARRQLLHELPNVARHCAEEIMTEIRAKVFDPAVEVLREAADSLPTGATIDTLARNGRTDLVDLRVAADRAIRTLKEAYDLRGLFDGTVGRADEYISKYTDPTAAAEIVAATPDTTEAVLSILRAGVGLVLLDSNGIEDAKAARRAEYEARRQEAIRRNRGRY